MTPTTLLGEITSTGHGTGTFVTSAFTPPSNSVMLVGINAMLDGGSSDESLTITVTGGGWTYNREVNVSSLVAYSQNLVIFAAEVATGASMQLTIDCGAIDVYVYGVSVVAFEGYDTGTPTGGIGTVIDTASPDGAQSFTLDVAPSTDDYVFGIIGMDKESLGCTPGSTFTEVHDLQSGAACGFESQQRTGSTSATVDWVDSHTGTGGIFKLAACGVVVKAAAGGAGGATPGGRRRRIHPARDRRTGKGDRAGPLRSFYLHRKDATSETIAGVARDLAGDSTAAAAFTGSATLELSLASSASAATSATGALVVDRPFAGTSPAAAGFTGAFARTAGLAGSTPAAAGFSGDIARAAGLAASSPAAAGFSGAATLAVALSASSPAASGITGAITLATAFAATSPAAAGFSAELSVQGSVTFDGVASAAAGFSAAIAREVGLAGSIPAAAGFSGASTITRALAASSPASAGFSGAVARAAGLAAFSPAAAGFTGDLSRSVTFAGIASAAAGFSGEVTRAAEFAGLSPAAAWAVGDLLVAGDVLFEGVASAAADMAMAMLMVESPPVAVVRTGLSGGVAWRHREARNKLARQMRRR